MNRMEVVEPIEKQIKMLVDRLSNTDETQEICVLAQAIATLCKAIYPQL